MALEQRKSSPTVDQRHFVEHLERASMIVRSWPAWKRSVLGRVELTRDDTEGESSRHCELSTEFTSSESR
jgi:hypothetical protein